MSKLNTFILVGAAEVAACAPAERPNFQPYDKVEELKETRSSDRGDLEAITASGEIVQREIAAAEYCRTKAPIFREEDMAPDLENMRLGILSVIHEEGCQGRVELDCGNDGILEASIEADCPKKH